MNILRPAQSTDFLAVAQLTCSKQARARILAKRAAELDLGLDLLVQNISPLPKFSRQTSAMQLCKRSHF